MNQKHLAVTSLLLFISLIIFSCRRDIKNYINDQVVPSESLESARVWHAKNLNKSIHNLRPKWDDSWMLKTSEGNLLVVPTPENGIKSKDHSIRRFYLFKYIGNNVTGGIIKELLGHKFNVNDNLEKLIVNAGMDRIDRFNGVIFTYDINYTQLNSLVYENGVKINAKARLQRMKAISMVGKNTNPNKLKSASASRSAGILIPSSHGKKIFMTIPEKQAVIPRREGFPYLEPNCIVLYDVIEYYTNDTLTDIVFRYVDHECPAPAGSSSTNASGTSSSSSGNTNYAGGGNNNNGGSGNTGSGGTGSGSNEIAIEITLDSITVKAPCFVNTVLNKLLAIYQYKEMVRPFVTQPNMKPTLRWNAKPMPWGQNNVYRSGETSVFPGSTLGMSSEIFLNTNLIQNGSKMLVAATAIHETFHAYVAFIFASNATPSFNPSSISYIGYHWLWNNHVHEADGDYSTHQVALNHQLDNFVHILQEFGGRTTNGSYIYSLADARMAILIGMNNPGPNATNLEAASMQLYYNSALNRYGLTQTQVENFFNTHKSVPVGSRVPSTPGCN